MEKVVEIAVSVATPLALLGLLLALVFYAYLRRLRHAEKQLELLPPDKRAASVDEFLTRYNIDGGNLTREQKFELIKEEMERRYRGARIKILVAAATFAVCFGVAAVCYTIRSAGPNIRTVRVSLEHQNRPLSTDFEVTLFVPEINPLRARGHDGDTSIQLLSDVREIDKIAVTCAGYMMKDNGPFKIENGKIVIQMVKKENAPPLRPDELPSDQAISDMPTKEMVEQPPKVQPTDVAFRYKNATSEDLVLFVFSCTRHYQKEPEGLAPNSPWLVWPLPATNEFLTYEKFQKGSGWYCFFVKSKKSTFDGRPTYLGRRNLFQSRIATLVVTETIDAEHRFQGVFGSED